jgi:hypothetical protein
MMKPPSRNNYVRNASFLHWLHDWLGVNHRDQKKMMIKKIPQVGIPDRYRFVNEKKVYRGMQVPEKIVHQFIHAGKFRLR